MTNMYITSNNIIDFHNCNTDFTSILKCIEQNYKNLSLKSLAKHFHYSEAYLSTLIKKNTGFNFIVLIKKLKMASAKNYLLNTNLTIVKISEYVGYNSADHFSRTFKKYYSISPQQYRDSIYMLKQIK